jgi:uncharacterized protein YdeI (YjbR/CyaY-like superfamily)
MPKTISNGTVHKIPTDLKDMLSKSSKLLNLWEDITPLARNEWICWIISPKKPETRAHRIQVAKSKLNQGDRRPCCWQGCSHRSQ